MIKEKPEYLKMKLHLEDPSNPAHWPTSQKEMRALFVLKEQRRFSEWKKQDAERRREKLGGQR